MPARRTQNVGFLVVAAASFLLACVSGFLSFLPGIDPAISGVLEVGFFGGGIVTLGAIAVYAVLSRRAGEPPSRFDRLLEYRAAALGAVPVGIVAVGVGAAWYAARRFGEAAAPPIAAPLEGAAPSFASIHAAGIAALLGFGTVYLLVAVVLAIRAERAAIRVAREEAEVSFE